jgi:tetratricopeptide (TPR) repeat protein/predicted phosphodiesterase
VALTWLHLSDFHVSAYGSYDRDVVLRALVASIAKLRETGHRPDLIFATGDIAAQGKPDEYELAGKLLDDLLDAAGLERRHLFLIPGNHDVDRDKGIGLARSLSSREESDAYFDPNGSIPHLALKQWAFREWYEDFFDGIRECPESSCGPVEQVEVDGKRIAILPVNSALFCQDDTDHAKLWVGRRALDNALADLRRAEADLRIGLIHHPLDWLADGERSNIRATLIDSVDFLLRGHLHDTEIEQVVHRHGNMLMMAAGAAYQTRRWPNRALYATVADSSLTILPIRYEDSPKETWTTDPSVFPDDDKHVGQFSLSAADSSSTDRGESSTTTEFVPAFRSNIPSTRGLPVVGRDAELAEMASTFGDSTTEQVLVLTGTPGVGKSELAREFARRQRERYPGGTFLIDASSTADIPVDLARVGSIFLGLEFPENLQLEEQCERALIAIGGAPTLLIFDNVRSFGAIERWLPPAGMACHVIITTVHEPAGAGWKSLNVAPLSQRQSEELVTALAGSRVGARYGSALASYAQGLPVQLCPMASVLAYEERRGRDPAKHLPSLADETHQSFSLVYELLDHPERLLLHAAASLNPQRISQKELATGIESAAGWSEADFNTALDACLDVHLIEGNATLRMHQLLVSFLQSIEAEDLSTLKEIRGAYQRRLASIAAALARNPADGDLAAELLGFRLTPEEWEEMGVAIPSELRGSLGEALLEIGEFEKARPWFEIAVEEARKKDADGRINHEHLSKCIHKVGFCYAGEGESQKALPWFKEAVEESREGDIDGSVDHDSLGRSIQQVGFCYASQLEFDQARVWFEEAVREKRKGDLQGRVNHDSLGRALHHVGYCYSSQKEFEKALPWYEEAVEEARQGDVQGRVNHDTLGRSLHQVGYCHSSQKEFEKALPWYEEAVEEKRQGDVYGRIDHDNMGRGLHQVGYCYSGQGHWREALPWYEEAVEEKRQGDVYGRIDHDNMGTSLHQVGYCHAKQGEPGKALPCYEEAIEEKRQGDIYGRIDRGGLATTLSSTAYVLRDLGESDEATKLEAEAKELED